LIRGQNPEVAVGLILVAALDEARAIGKGNAMPWHLPADLKRFKQLTLGHSILMGGNTARSLGRALPGRRNLVLTRAARAPFEDMEAVASINDAIQLAGNEDLMVIGGGEVYTLALAQATGLRLTHVHTRIDGADAFFPAWSREDWQEHSRETHAADDRHAFAFDFVDYRRKA
jgi:dihydrofolate reductase